MHKPDRDTALSYHDLERIHSSAHPSWHHALDFAFNNAGVEQPITAISEITEEEWNRNIRINLSGVFLCMKNEIPLMLKQGGGAIVNKAPGTASVCPVAAQYPTG